MSQIVKTNIYVQIYFRRAYHHDKKNFKKNDMFCYDANGNITSVFLKKSTESAYTKQQQFAYDELNQLIRADDLAKKLYRSV